MVDLSKTTLRLGDSLDVLKEFPDNSVDSVVTDAPYGLAFMGKKWDYDVPSTEIWEECMRVLKPGGHLLSFAGSRTYHRMAVRIEDAGFEIRDQIMWVYGSGFPKSHNIGKAVDKIQGNDRAVVGENPNVRKADSQKNTILEGGFKEDDAITKGNSDWEGWGTALKPAHEPIVMARKPFSGTVANNVLEYGTGAINIDDCRVGSEVIQINKLDYEGKDWYKEGSNWTGKTEQSVGRFPANIIFDEEAGKILDEQSGITKGTGKPTITKAGLGGGILGQYDGRKTMPTSKDIEMVRNVGDTGGASRFFYCPKASKKDRDEGLTTEIKSIKGRDEGQDKTAIAYKARPTERQNIHPTVKPTDLMQYLIRLVTKKGGVVLDPFMGSGSTGKAAIKEGMIFVGIEREAEYFEIAKQRIKNELDKNEPKHNFW